MSVDNIVRASFVFGKSTKTRGLHQWDYGQVLRFEGLDLPSAYTVHFANQPMSGDAKTQVGGADGVDIPDEYLTTGLPVYAWVYLHSGADDGETVYSVTIPVTKRPQPTEEPPTPQQQGAINQAIAALNAGVEQVEGIAEAIPQTIDAALTEAKESGEFDGPPGPQGEQGEPGQDGVSPTVTVTQTATGATITVTDAEGTTTANLTNGQDGAPGQPGTPGSDGVSPTVTVTDITGGHRVTITDAEGAHVFDVMDGEDGGTYDYADLTNKPQINSVTLSGNKSLSDIGAASVADVAEKYTKPLNGIPKTDLASDVQASLGKADTALQSAPVQSVNGQTGAVALDAQDVGAYEKPATGIPETDLANDVQISLGKADTALQSAPVTSVNTKTGAVVLTPGDIGAGTYSKPSGGIPKTDLASGVQNSLDAADSAYQKPATGIPASDLASGVIPSVPVQDVQVNGTSVLSNGVANVPMASASTPGVVISGSVSVSGSTPTINAQAGVRYICGEVATLDITLPASGCVDVIFQSGSTATVLMITPPSGVTVKWANGFDPTALDANTTYELNISDGLGVAGSWT